MVGDIPCSSGDEPSAIPCSFVGDVKYDPSNVFLEKYRFNY